MPLFDSIILYTLTQTDALKYVGMGKVSIIKITEKSTSDRAIFDTHASDFQTEFDANLRHS